VIAIAHGRVVASLDSALYDKGPSIKEIRNQGVVQCGQEGGGLLQMRTSALFGGEKLSICQNLWYVCTNKGVEPVLTFFG